MSNITTWRDFKLHKSNVNPKYIVYFKNANMP